MNKYGQVINLGQRWFRKFKSEFDWKLFCGEFIKKITPQNPLVK